MFAEPEGVRWPDTGVDIQIMQPGQPNCRYHMEPDQEDFLVLHGECIAIVEGEERPMRQWDFLHCPAGTKHVFTTTPPRRMRTGARFPGSGRPIPGR